IQDKPFDFEHAVSCATEVAQKMGASEKEMVMVAGFAGGLGLSGSGCGALSAALWMNALNWCREHKVGSAIEDPKAKELMRVFAAFTDDRYLCEEISQTHFTTVKAHTDYIKNGGCSELIDVLSEV
ncbi:C-GCAxxG-C-C family (seleno)protein, partial [Lutimonas sp.]|uniref:C-GCAxxG-C-C family (seleno)protein n=1 Tax=Lutimonas sp. TaxID=1872403 RepID=UPI003C78F43F